MVGRTLAYAVLLAAGALMGALAAGLCGWVGWTLCPVPLALFLAFSRLGER